LLRFLANGNLDPSFGTGGTVTTDFGDTDQANGVVVQPDGKIFVVGTTVTFDQISLSNISSFALARYNPDGSLDSMFGTGGKTTTDLGDHTDEAHAVVLQPEVVLNLLEALKQSVAHKATPARRKSVSLSVEATHSPASCRFPLVYDELRKLAAVRMAEEKPGHTLNATALVGAHGRPRSSTSVFQALADMMLEHPDLEVKMFLDIQRRPGDTTAESELVRRFATNFRNQEWPEARPVPTVFYDPRSLELSPPSRSCLHAKCVAVDRRLLFVSSANFTEAAQERNLEVGVLIHSPSVAEQLVNHFDTLLSAGVLQRAM
jgi:uncharacterized delta-60 repeat protein